MEKAKLPEEKERERVEESVLDKKDENDEEEESISAGIYMNAVTKCSFREVSAGWEGLRALTELNYITIPIEYWAVKSEWDFYPEVSSRGFTKNISRTFWRKADSV